jgi:hypothetical protein
VSNDNSLSPSAPDTIEEKPEIPVNLKTWHRPVISRIEIAQTLNASGLASDGDNPHS